MGSKHRASDLELQIQRITGDLDFNANLQDAVRNLLLLPEFIGMDVRLAAFEADVEIGKISSATDAIISQDTDLVFSYANVFQQLAKIDGEWRIFHKNAIMNFLGCETALKLTCLATFSGKIVFYFLAEMYQQSVTKVSGK